MWNSDILYVLAGDRSPFLQTNKVTFARLGEAILRFKLKIHNSHLLGSLQSRSSFVLSLTVRAEDKEAIEEFLKCKLSYSPDIRLGMKTIPSIKWQDKEGIRYYSEYPSKDRPVL